MTEHDNDKLKKLHESTRVYTERIQSRNSRPFVAQQYSTAFLKAIPSMSRWRDVCE